MPTTDFEIPKEKTGEQERQIKQKGQKLASLNLHSKYVFLVSFFSLCKDFLIMNQFHNWIQDMF